MSRLKDRSSARAQATDRALAPTARHRIWRLLLPFAASVSLLSCSPSIIRVPLPESQVAYASAVAAPSIEMGAIRAWGDEKPPWIDQFLNAPDEQVKASFPGVYGKRHAYLALSGGGENGAYGSGLLTG